MARGLLSLVSFCRQPLLALFRVWPPATTRALIALAILLMGANVASATTKPVISYSPSSVVLTLGTTITTITPINTGGTATSWAVTPALPAGVNFAVATGQISGKPAVLSTVKTYTVKATNTAGSGSIAIKITVDDIQPTLSYSPSAEACTKGTAIEPLEPITGGGPVVTWTISPALSVGLTFSKTSGGITGTPTAIKASTVYTIKATNTGGSATASVTLTVGDIPPVMDYSPATYTLTKGRAITTISPVSTGGTITSWSVAPALPAGLNLGAATGKITGTPTVLSPATLYTITGTNSGGTATTSLTLTVDDRAPAFSYTPATDTYTLNTAITPLSPVSTGGTVLTWSVAPALPAGLSLDPGTGQIAGTPTVQKSMTTYTITGTNTGGTGAAKIKITVNDLTPAIGYSPSTYAFTKGMAIAAITPATSGGAVSSWGVSPSLPAGLVLNTANGQITGTPTALTAKASYTVTATNGEGSAETALFITVNDAPPAILAYSSNPAIFTQGMAIAADSPSSGGGAVVSYSVTPPLPAGLGLNPTSGLITGVPAALTATTTYTVTASNTGGSTTVPVSITVIGAAATPVISGVPTYVTAGTTGLTASVPIQPGCTFAWSVTGGVLTAGASTNLVTFIAGASGYVGLSCVANNAAGAPSSAGTAICTIVAVPVITSFTANPANIDWGAASTLTGSFSGGTGSIDQSVGPVSNGSGMAVSPMTMTTYTLTVTNPAGTSVTQQVTVSMNQVLVGITPATPTIGIGQSLAFSASVTGAANQAVTWSVQQGSAGSITSAGLYTAPATTGTNYIIATSQVDPAASASIPIEVAQLVITVSPSLICMPIGGSGTLQFSANVTNTIQTAVNWSTNGGNISQAGVFTPGSSTGTFQVTATVVGDSSASATATVNLASPQPGSCTNGPSLPSPYADTRGFQLTMLKDGQVLMTGGEAGGQALASAYLYDSTLGTLTAAGSMQSARAYHSATLLASGMVLIVGGNDSTGVPQDSAELFNPANNTFTPTLTMPTQARAWHTATMTNNNKVLIVGGAPGAELYDPIAGTFSSTSNPPIVQRMKHSATLLADGTVLLAGGQAADGSAIGNAEIYTTDKDLFASDPWTLNPTTVPLQSARYGHSATLLSSGGNLVLIAGGYDSSGSPTAAVEYYSMTFISGTGSAITGTSSPGSSLCAPRADHISVMLPNGNILLAGGTLQSTEIFESATSAWRDSCPLNGVPAGGVLLENGKVWTVGGATAQSVLYDPQEPSSGIFVPILGPDQIIWWAGGIWPLPPNQAMTWERYSSAIYIWDFDTRTQYPGGSLVVPRTIPSMAQLPDGKILIVGGNSDYATAVTTCEIYDPATATSTPTGSLLYGRRSPYAITIRGNTSATGKVAIIGGTNDSLGTSTNVIEIFDENSGTFYPSITLDNSYTYGVDFQMPYEFGGYMFQGAAVALDDGNIFIYAKSPLVTMPIISIFNPIQNSIYQTFQPIYSRNDANFILLADGRILASGGDQSPTTAEIFDPRQGTWSSTGNLAQVNGRRAHSAILMKDNRVLIVGGGDPITGDPIVTAEIFEPSTALFTLVPQQFFNSMGPISGFTLDNGRVILSNASSNSRHYLNTLEFRTNY